MGKITAWMKNHRPSARRLAQLYAALLYNAHGKGWIEGEIYTGKLKGLCVPGLNCYSCPGAVGACPLGALQNALTSAGHGAGWYVLGMLTLMGTVLGRTVCGWLCPAGLIQELLHKIPTRKIRKSRVTRYLSWLRYGVLALFAVLLPLWFGAGQGTPLPAFCKYICPVGTLEGAVGLLAHPGNEALFGMLGEIFTLKWALLLVIGLGCVFCYRAFCRFLCPLGAIYGLFNRFSLVGVKVAQDKCVGCGACVRHCEMDVRKVGDAACIQCGRCMADCPQGAITLQCGKITLQGPQDGPVLRRRRRAVGAAALAALLAVTVYVNGIEAPGRAAPAQAGSEEGAYLPDFAVPTVGGGEFRLEDQRGRVVMINLWATYCAPCVRELDDFSRLQAEYPDLTVLAVHASLTTEDVEAYLAARDWALTFAVDTEEDTVFSAVGGSALLPQTVVLDRTGRVIYNRAGSVDYDQLAALYREAAQ